MAKPIKKIDTATVLADIRDGMSDSALMNKYELSPMALQSLLKKLDQKGLLSVISARDFLRDLRMGMRDVDLMAKYKLSAKSLGNIIRMGTGFSHILQCGFFCAKSRIFGFTSGSLLLLACADEKMIR